MKGGDYKGKNFNPNYVPPHTVEKPVEPQIVINKPVSTVPSEIDEIKELILNIQKKSNITDFLGMRDLRVSLLRNAYKDKHKSLINTNVNFVDSEYAMPWILLSNTDIPNFSKYITSFERIISDKKISYAMFEPAIYNKINEVRLISSETQFLLQLYWMAYGMKKLNIFVPVWDLDIIAGKADLKYTFGDLVFTYPSDIFVLMKVVNDIYISDIVPDIVYHNIIATIFKKYSVDGSEILNKIEKTWTMEETILMISPSISITRPLIDSQMGIHNREPKLSEIQIGHFYITTKKSSNNVYSIFIVLDIDRWNNMILGRIVTFTTLLNKTEIKMSDRIMVTTEDLQLVVKA